LKERKPLDVKALLEQAKTSEHKEACRILERSHNYRIGAGARLTSPDQMSFYIEILVYLCTDSSQVDLEILEKSVACLKELQRRNYSLDCQDSNCISCEVIVPPQNLAVEYETAKSIMNAIFEKGK
jgi:hypothetical protein